MTTNGMTNDLRAAIVSNEDALRSDLVPKLIPSAYRHARLIMLSINPPEILSVGLAHLTASDQ